MTSSSRLTRIAVLLAATALPALAAGAAPRYREIYRPLTCQAEIGPGRAADMVGQCLAVSPGRAACNAINTCATVAGEIRRGCLDADDDDRYPFCAAYNVDRSDED